MFKKVISFVLSVVFSLQTCGLAQAAQFSLAGYLGQGSGAPALDRFRPASLRYFSYEPDSDNFKILLDKADEKGLSDVQVKDKADELMRYFRIGLSLPDDKFWVNLRPDAPEQIIDPELERTDIGKIMLEADLQLKKDTSSLTSPQTKEGKVYWDKLYKKVGELFGTENITIPTITRPWIVPGEIIVRQSGNSAYIYKAALKVMLEEDYLTSRGGSRTAPTYQQYAFSDPRLKELNQYSTQLIRELIIPQLTKEVNRAKRYAGLRQVYYSLILARWFKGKFQGLSPKGTVPELIDSGNLDNLASQEPWSKDTYYQGYKKSFEQGEYNLSETVRTPTGQVIRRYISGGEVFTSSALKVTGQYDTVGFSIVKSVSSKLINYPSDIKPVVKAAASALNSENKENERLVSAIKYVAKKFSELTAIGGITLYASGGMMGLGVTALYNDEDFRSGLDEIIKSISKYKKPDSWRIEFEKGSTFEQIKKRLLSEAGITASLAITMEAAEEIITGVWKKEGLTFKKVNDIVLQYPIENSLFKENEEIRAASVSIKIDDIKCEYIEVYSYDFMGAKSIRFRFFINKQETEYPVLVVDIQDTNYFSVAIRIEGLLADEKSAEEFALSFLTVLGGASSALTLKEAKSEIIRILGNIDFRIVNGNKEGALARLDIMGKSFEHLYDVLAWILRDSSGIPNESKKKLERALNSLKLGILADELKEQGVTADMVQMNLSDVNALRQITIADVELKVEIKFSPPDGINILLSELKGNKYVDAGGFFLPYSIPDKGPYIMVYHLNNKETFSVEDIKVLAREIATSLGISGVSSALVNKVAATKDIGAVDFRAMDMLIQPAGSFRGLDFSPVALSSSALEAIDLENGLEGINLMTLGRRRPHPQRLKEYVSACIFKGKIDEKADDFILSMLEVFQLQAEEGIESASQDREAVVLADTRGYTIPGKGREGIGGVF